MFNSKKNYFISYLFFTITFLFYISPIKSCETKTTCVDCITLTAWNTIIKKDSNVQCKWETETCSVVTSTFSQNSNINSLLWYKAFETYCPISAITDSNFCGITSYTSETKQAKFFLEPQPSNQYGKTNLLCKYTYINEKPKTPLKLTVYQNTEELISKGILQLEADFSDNSTAKQLFDQKEQMYKLSGCKEMNFYFLSIDAFNKLPFEIIIEEFIEKKDYTLLIILIVVSVVIVILGVIICVCARKVCKKKEDEYSNDDISLGNRGRYSRRNRQRIEEMNKKKRKEELEEFLNNKLIVVEYNDELKELGDNCTICLNNFQNEDKIRKTKCKHLFHSECFEKWVQGYEEKEILKCPNCNVVLLGCDNQTEEGGERNEVLQLNNNTNTNNISSTNNIRDNNTYENVHTSGSVGVPIAVQRREENK
jgi:hypothetical protein